MPGVSWVSGNTFYDLESVLSLAQRQQLDKRRKRSQRTVAVDGARALSEAVSSPQPRSVNIRTTGLTGASP